MKGPLPPAPQPVRAPQAILLLCAALGAAPPAGPSPEQRPHALERALADGRRESDREEGASAIAGKEWEMVRWAG